MAHPISFVYRLVLTWLEPMLAFGGVIQVLTDPLSYLSIANPNAHAHYNPALHPIFTQIAGGWMIIVFNDVVTLRVFSRDVKVWSFVLGAHLVSDIIYTYALYEDLGFERFFNVMVWNFNDWLTIATTIPPMLLKVTFLMGIGVNKTATASGKKRN